MISSRAFISFVSSLSISEHVPVSNDRTGLEFLCFQQLLYEVPRFDFGTEKNRKKIGVRH